MVDFDTIRDLVKNSKLFEAYRYLRGVDKDDIPDDIPYESICSRVELVEELRRQSNTDDDWILQADSDGIRTLYRPSDDGTTYSVKITGNVEASMFDLLALFHEVDLFNTWLPSYQYLGLKTSRVLEQPSAVELLAALTISIPPPFSERDVALYCDGVDCMDDEENKQIAVLLASIDHPDAPVTDDVVRAEVSPPSGILLTPLGGGSTCVCIVVNVNPKLTVIPSWLIELAVRNFAYLCLVAIRNASAQVQGEVYQSKMRNRHDPFYMHLRKRIAESMPEELDSLPPLDDDSFVSAASSFASSD